MQNEVWRQTYPGRHQGGRIPIHGSQPTSGRRRKRDRKYKRMKKNATDELRAEVKQLQREIQKMLRRSYWQYVGDLFKEDDQMGDSRPCLKKFWTYMKHQRSSSAGIPSLKVQGRLITDPKLKAETLNSQFNKAFSEGNDYTAEEFARKCSMPDDREDHLPMEDITLSVESVERSWLA